MKKIKLKNVISYSKLRANSKDLSIGSYVTTDNLLPNKLGVKVANSLPPNGGSFPKYKEGDILVSNIRPYLKKIWFADRTGICSSDVLTFETENGFSPKFIYYNLFQDAFFEHMMKGSKGTKMPRGEKSQILEFEIPDFSFSVQEKIAEFLSAIDNKIKLNNEINDNLEQMAKTLYDYWFVQFDFPDDDGKPYMSSGGKMVWNEELKREIPLGWYVKELDCLINIFDSKRVPLSRSQREKKCGNIPYYGATSIMGYVDEYIFNDDFILLAEDGSVMDDEGFPIVQFIWGKTWVNNHAHVLQAKDKSNNEFIFQLVKTISVVQIMTGSIQMKINQENLKNVKVILPDNNSLKSFSKCAIPIRKKLINNIEENQELATLRDWLLPMLMNGQVKVQE